MDGKIIQISDDSNDENEARNANVVEHEDPDQDPQSQTQNGEDSVSEIADESSIKETDEKKNGNKNLLFGMSINLMDMPNQLKQFVSTNQSLICTNFETNIIFLYSGETFHWLF